MGYEAPIGAGELNLEMEIDDRANTVSIDLIPFGDRH